MERNEKINDNQLHALSVLIEEKSLSVDTAIAHKNIFNALHKKGLISCTRYANDERWEITDKGIELIDNMQTTKKKIIVISKEFKPWGEHGLQIDVDSRMYDGVTGKPIVDKDNYILGQVSSDMRWAFQDITTRYKDDLDKAYGEKLEYDFVFYYVTLDFIKTESKSWWDGLSEDDKIWAMMVAGYEKRHPDRATRADVKEMWMKQRMKDVAETKLKKIMNLYQIV